MFQAPGYAVGEYFGPMAHEGTVRRATAHDDGCGQVLALSNQVPRVRARPSPVSAPEWILGVGILPRSSPKVPIAEGASISAVNPYGRTKLVAEQLIGDLCAATPALNAVLLRYFNLIGAQPSRWVRGLGLVLAKHPPPQ